MAYGYRYSPPRFRPAPVARRSPASDPEKTRIKLPCPLPTYLTPQSI